MLPWATVTQSHHCSGTAADHRQHKKPHEITQHGTYQWGDCLLIWMVWIICVRKEVGRAVCFDQPRRAVLIRDDVRAYVAEVVAVELVSHERRSTPANARPCAALVVVRQQQDMCRAATLLTALDRRIASSCFPRQLDSRAEGSPVGIGGTGSRHG